MPFGSVFAALYYGLLCTGMGVGLMLEAPGHRFAGACFVVLGASLAIALVRRSAWARWAGCFSALIVAVFALSRVMASERVLDLVLLLASVATAALLAWPAAGRVTQPGSAAPALRFSTAAAVLGLVVGSLWSSAQGERRPATQGPAAIPAAARASSTTSTTRIDWAEFAPGLERARALDCPVVATFVTDWCGYCNKMNQETWRSPQVIERLSGLVAVRVDAEGTSEASGPSGSELASRYGIRGLPANFILKHDGSILSRRDGYLSAQQFLAWLDSTVGAGGVSRAATPAGS